MQREDWLDVLGAVLAAIQAYMAGWSMPVPAVSPQDFVLRAAAGSVAAALVTLEGDNPQKRLVEALMFLTCTYTSLIFYEWGWLAMLAPILYNLSPYTVAIMGKLSEIKKG